MTTTTQEQVLEHIAASPEGKRALAEIEAERLERRRDQAGELVVCEAEIRDALPSLDGALEKAKGGVRAAEAKVTTARATYTSAYQRRALVLSAHDRRRGGLESDLIATASRSIDAFQREISEIAEAVRGDLRISRGSTHWLTWTRLPGESNYETIVATLEAIREAREQAEGLKLEALDDADVEQRLAGLRKTVQDAWGSGD